MMGFLRFFQYTKKFFPRNLKVIFFIPTAFIGVKNEEAMNFATKILSKK